MRLDVRQRGRGESVDYLFGSAGQSPHLVEVKKHARESFRSEVGRLAAVLPHSLYEDMIVEFCGIGIIQQLLECIFHRSGAKV